MLGIDINVLSLDMNIVWTFVNILILFLFFRVFLFKPVNNILEQRQKLIEDDMEAAKKSKEEAEQLKSEYQKVLEDAENETVEIIKSAKERAQVEYRGKPYYAGSKPFYRIRKEKIHGRGTVRNCRYCFISSSEGNSEKCRCG